jgi:AcrR family transcriptional regulator
MTMREVTAGTTREDRVDRPRDAAASKNALLQAAKALFSQQGFEGTTIREIGEQAGVDASLIARYFGSKADLYIAAVVADDAGESVPSEYGELGQMADATLTRADRRGPGPILQAIARSDSSAEIRDAALDRVSSRLVGPLADKMTARGNDRPQLRAQVAVSALLGISLGRSLGWFEEMRSVPRDELVTLIVDALGSITGDGPERAGLPR